MRQRTARSQTNGRFRQEVHQMLELRLRERQRHIVYGHMQTPVRTAMDGALEALIVGAVVR